MSANKTASVATSRAVQKDRCDATVIQPFTDPGHSSLVRYLCEFADARAALRGYVVCVRFAGSALAYGLCGVNGRVKASDRTGLLLVVPGNLELDGSEIVSLTPWVTIERVSVGWAEGIFPEEVSS